MAGTSAAVLVATGPDQRTLLTIAGSSGISLNAGSSSEILDANVPVGRRWFHVAAPQNFAVGDTIQLERRGNADWISHIKMDQIPPRPDGAPITQWTPFDLPAVSFWQINGDGKDDTAHANRFVAFDHMRDGWARDVAAEHFTLNTAGMFYTGSGSMGITIEDCSALSAAASFYAGTGYDSSGRYHLATGIYVGRYGFLFGGQNGLVCNCYTIIWWK